MALVALSRDRPRVFRESMSMGSAKLLLCACATTAALSRPAVHAHRAGTPAMSTKAETVAAFVRNATLRALRTSFPSP